MRRRAVEIFSRAMAPTRVASRAQSASSDAPRRASRWTMTHEVVRATSSGGATSTYDIALADRAFDLIGDATAFRGVRAPGERVVRGEVVAEVEWRGFTRTAGDELYHSRWANASGTREILAPFDCVIERFNAAAIEDAYMNVRGPETWLVEVRAKSGACAALLDEDEYEALVEKEEIEAADRANAAYP